MQHRIIKLTAAATIIVMVTIAIGIAGKFREQQKQIEDLRNENRQLLSNMSRNEPITDVKALTAENTELGKATVETELEVIDRMFAAKDIEGLAGMVENGRFASKVVSANYLAEIGDQSAFSALNELGEQFESDGTGSCADVV